MEQVKWGLIGAGDVCERKAGPPLYQMPNSELILVNRRDRAAGEDFVRRHDHGRYLGDLAALLASDEINAVYVATPHDLHAEQTIAALEAGMPEALVLRGDKGSVHLSDLKGGELVLRRGAKGDSGSEQGAYEYCGGLPWTHWGLFENFIEHLRSGAPLLCDGTEGPKSTVILDALAEVKPGVARAKIVY